jgi:hypothetical protein
VAPRATASTVLGLGISTRSLVGSLLLGLVLVPVVGAATYDRVRRRPPG